MTPDSLLVQAIHLLRADGQARRGSCHFPFSEDDVTAGAETELQAVVIAPREQADLPIAIENSSYFRNIRKRMATGEMSRSIIKDLERFLRDNPGDVWENSWVRFPRRRLTIFADDVFRRDLLADKSNPAGPLRSDADRFTFIQAGEEWLRIPVSYLLKLALADAVSRRGGYPVQAWQTGEGLMEHFLNDNTSPETYSFYVVPLSRRNGRGKALALESAQRFLLTQLLTQYANAELGLRENGQRAITYFAPHPPVRQRELNDLITDSFYRELFMSPCLSGWDRGEEKSRYMHLCHETLSRSQLNTLAKLRESGIITYNLVLMPSLSNISLANNGTHISLGSRRLTALLADSASGYTASHEKAVGDLAIKTVEHFLPLFVGSYSAAPYRLGFSDFHPQKVLGFLAHELDYTHLRMIWRRWKKKAKLKVFDYALTPFGPPLMDEVISRVCQLAGDCVPDFRLIDYFVSIMSTEDSPALDGRLGSAERLKRDLQAMGVFDVRMPLYLLYRLREFSTMGFSGFEGRHYSLFPSFRYDLGPAAELQALVTALAFKYILEGRLTNADVPDTVAVESERRQIFFGAAIGLPTFYVRSGTENRFLARILEKARNTRFSKRYKGYVRVHHQEYRRALLEILRQDAADIVDQLGCQELLRDLAGRIDDPGSLSAYGRLVNGIVDRCGGRSPLHIKATEFNSQAEVFYRETLRRTQLEEALELISNDLQREDGLPALRLPGGRRMCDFLAVKREALLEERMDAEDLTRMIHLVLLSIGRSAQACSVEHAIEPPSIH
jgi:hypothetical protein